MNLSEITTPADITRFNKANQTVVDKVVDIMVNDGNVFDNMPIILFALRNLVRWHHVNAVECLNGNLDNNPAMYAFDEGKLAAALSILESVEMPEPDSHKGDDEFDAQTA